MRKLFIVASVILVVALIICFAPLKTVAYAVTIDYEDVETYYEDEPYETIEIYYEDEPYEDTENYSEAVPLSYDAVNYVKEDTIKEHRQIIIGGIVFQDEVVEIPIQVACVDVKNTDTIAGTFTIVFNVAEPMFGEPSLNRKLDLTPSQMETATCPSENLGVWNYKVTASTKTIEKQRVVTKYRQVEKQRTVTEYRQVEKQRTVWKERPETHYRKVTLLDYFLYYLFS